MKFFSQVGASRLTFSLLCLSGCLLLVQPCRAGSIGFENTGSLAQAREYHTATLLPNGKVLVVGGHGDNPNEPIADLASAELYDPSTRTWSATGSLTDRRQQHTATLLPDGRVLVVGGNQFAFDLASAELYDPATGTWTPTGSLNVRRRNHTATLLPNGKVLVAGGIQEDLGFGYFTITSAELYDPATGTWSVTGSLATARGDHTATLLSSGKVLVAGGRPSFSGAGNPPITSTELYDPGSGTWSATGNLNFGRYNHTATLLPSGEVLAAAGFANGSIHFSAEVYNPATGTWRMTGNLSARRAWHTATLLPGNKVLVAGGFGADYPFGSYASAELYDPANGTWTTTGSLVTRREQHTATLLPDGTVLVAGGIDRDSTGNGNTHPLVSAELYPKSIPTLLNISTRMHVQTGDNVLIAGFIITGTEQKTVIVRGIGPSLPMAGALADPVIEVHGPSGELLGTNDNWNDAATRQQISDSGLAPRHELESALWGVINPGAYTVILRGKDGGTGVGSVEVYDLDEPADSRLANISTRGLVETGDNVMIAGLIVGGGSSFGTANVVVRALGPSLPVSGALANPTLELHDQDGNLIAFNDDWKTRPDGTSQQAEIEATRVSPAMEPESAFVRRLPPGSYTAIVRGKDDSTGIGLVEVYHLQ
jgi:N-acetylneuraminic acid mutarotase